jgi:ATP-dependent exoDNAse (exonuclease V) beta subunit
VHQLELRPGEPFEIVWWDPHALRLDAERPFGLRRQELIAKDVAPEVIAAGQRAYITWREARAVARTQGERPSLTVRTATEWSADAAATGASPSVELVQIATAPGRPSGARFGTLIHAVLAVIPLTADAATVAAFVATQARIVGATSEERQSALDVIDDVLRHPLFDAARRADGRGRCLRETPLTLTIDRELVEGTVDFAFEEDGEFVVVDFKTDRPDEERRRR